MRARVAKEVRSRCQGIVIINAHCRSIHLCTLYMYTAVYGVWCTVYTVRRILYDVYYTACSVRRTYEYRNLDDDKLLPFFFNTSFRFSDFHLPPLHHVMYVGARITQLTDYFGSGCQMF